MSLAIKTNTPPPPFTEASAAAEKAKKWRLEERGVSTLRLLAIQWVGTSHHLLTQVESAAKEPKNRHTHSNLHNARMLLRTIQKIDPVSAQLIVLYKGDEAAAFARISYFKDRDVKLCDFCVNPEVIANPSITGVGSRFLIAIAKQAAEFGYNRILVEPKEYTAAFYVRNGFMKYGEDLFYKDLDSKKAAAIKINPRDFPAPANTPYITSEAETAKVREQIRTTEHTDLLDVLENPGVVCLKVNDEAGNVLYAAGVDVLDPETLQLLYPTFFTEDAKAIETKVDRFLEELTQTSHRELDFEDEDTD